jgi:tetratricopeptide (TPR) repeat protein
MVVIANCVVCCVVFPDAEKLGLEIKAKLPIGTHKEVAVAVAIAKYEVDRKFVERRGKLGARHVTGADLLPSLTANTISIPIHTLASPNMESDRGPPRVKNKAAAPQQISAEQLLREAVDRQEPEVEKPTQRFADLEELHEYQGRKRKEFEDYVRRNRLNTGNWMRYAVWELEQKEFRRARSVFERALDVDPTNVQLWMRYVDSEMKERNINHARNVLDRAVTIQPRLDKLWYKYVYMEEMLGQIPNVRQVFERWMSWEPDEAAWSAYIKLETLYNCAP